MADKTTAEFDFDDWAGLYIENPQEFEARRQAALMIELSKGSDEQRKAGRAMLDAYEKRVSDCSSQDRIKVAGEMMAESAMQLNTELMILRKTLQDSVDNALASESELNENI